MEPRSLGGWKQETREACWDVGSSGLECHCIIVGAPQESPHHQTVCPVH